MMMLNNMNVQTPFSFTVAFTDGYFDDPYRGRTNFNVFPFSGDFATNTTFQIPTAASVYQPDWRQPYTQNWNLTLEHSIATWVFQASYVGAKATNLTGNYDMNAPIYDSSKTLQQNQATVNQRRPMPQYQRVMALFNGLNSIYNSFQLSINKRFSRGFSIQSAYTFSRAIDQFSTNNEINSQVMQNPFNFHMVRGLSNYDHTHRLTTSFVWSLPKLGKTLKSRALGIVTDDWQFSGICSASTGAPFGINSTNDAMASAGTAFASLVGNLALPSGRSRGDQIKMYFNTAAVAQAQPGTYGNLGRNVMRYPSNSGADVSMTRMIPLKFRESANLTFRTEFFGLFNHPQLGAPNTSIGQSTFGTISSVGGTRVLQMSLKVGF
jgi:hypothetical protein